MSVPYGIHFDMDEATYFAIPALSASGIKHMRASPLDFWVRSPLNPNLADVQEEEGPNSEALQIGKAFDVRIISGRAAFDSAYVAGPEKADHPDCIDGCDDMKAECKALGIKGYSKVGKAGLIQLLLDNGYPAEKLWPCIEAKFQEQHPGKTFLYDKWPSKIEIAAAMIEKDPVLSKAFTGGAPQVTIVWHCDKIGVDCKARLDYLKPHAIVDLKTFLNQRGLPLAQAVNREIVNRRYHVQAAFYLEAAEHVANFLEGLPYGKGPLDGMTDAPTLELLRAYAANHPKTFLWVFQVKGVAPAAMGRSLPAESGLLVSARSEIEAAKQTYRQCLEHYGPNVPWVTPTAIEPLNDDDYPPWMVD